MAPWLADGHPAPHVVTGHVGTCLRCQAELSRHRRARRQLHHLAACAVTPPAGGLEATLDALHALDDLPASGRPAPSVVATAAAGAAAGVAGVLAWRRHQAG